MLPYTPHPKEIGEGWRELRRDELLAEGDEFWDIDEARWRPIGWPACKGKTGAALSGDWREDVPHIRRRT